MNFVILYVVLAFNTAPPLHYMDMATCENDAALLRKSEDVISAVCKPATYVVRGSYHPPKP